MPCWSYILFIASYLAIHGSGCRDMLSYPRTCFFRSKAASVDDAPRSTAVVVSFRRGTTASLDLSKSIYMNRLKHPLDNPVLADELRGSRFQGNSEIYGLGIRTGLYLQLESSVVANQMLASTGVALARTHNIFAIAVVIAVFVPSFARGDQCVFSVDVVILYHLFMGHWLAPGQASS
jgi:hypothetical protein